MGTIFLMYHELEQSGRPTCRTENGYLRYVVRASTFRDQLARIRDLGLNGVSVGEALAGPEGEQPRLALTFDDGCETDLLIAAPQLAEFGFTATSYVVVSFLGRPGYLSPAQLRELASCDWEIGCHSLTHAYLTDLDAPSLQEEIATAKHMLEQLLGRPVLHFSCPGGRWNRRVASVARAAGFRTVATSRIGSNAIGTDRYCLARLAVQRDTSLTAFTRMCEGRGLWRRRWMDRCLAAAKGLLGNRLYEDLRSTVLGRS